MMRSFGIACLLALGLVTPALADVPQTISYQGVLTDNSGNIVPDGPYDLAFKIYDVSIGGSEKWSEPHVGVVVTKGGFGVLLGGINPLTLTFDKPYWLGVSVNAGLELSPRVALASSPYALGLRLPFFGYASRDTTVFRIVNLGTGPGLRVDAQAGNSAVQLPDNSIAAAEVLDEPGLSKGSYFQGLTVPAGSTMQDVATTTITTPSTGVILVQAAGEAGFFGTTASNVIAFQIDDAAGGGDLPGEVQTIGAEQAPNTNYSYYSFAAIRVFGPTPAGIHTFRLEARKLNANGTAYFFNPKIVAVYLPTTYGPVSSPESLSEARVTR